MPPPAWLPYGAPPPDRSTYRYPGYDRPPYEHMDRQPMPGQPYGRMLGYDPYMHQSGFSRYSDRAVFDYSDRGDSSRYGDRPSYDSASGTGSRSGFSLQVVDYNHGSLSEKSADDRGAEKEPERERELPVASDGDRERDRDRDRDVVPREKVSGTESQQTLYRSLEDKAGPTRAFDADVDIKYIQDMIVSFSHYSHACCECSGFYHPCSEGDVFSTVCLPL